MRIITGRAVGSFYYIVVLFLLTCISPFLENILIKKDTNRSYRIIDVAVLLITPGYAALIYYLLFTKGNAFTYYTMLLPAWILFYYLGLRTRILGPQHNKKNCIIVILISLLLQVIEAFVYWRKGVDIEFVIGQLTISSICYTIAIIILFYVIWNENTHYQIEHRQVFGRTMIWFGDHSYIIYLSHCLILFFLNRMLGTLGLPWIVYYNVVFIGVTLISYLSITFVEKLTKGTKVEKYLKYIGF